MHVLSTEHLKPYDSLCFFEFEDYLSTPDPDVFNGQFKKVWAGVAAGAGYGIATIHLGGAQALISHGVNMGVDNSIGGTVGWSWTTWSTPLDCGCGDQ